MAFDDAIFQAIARLWFGGKVLSPHRKRVGKLTVDFCALGASPEAIEIALERYMREWPNCEPSPEAIIKWWPRFTAGGGKPKLTRHKPAQQQSIWSAQELHDMREREDRRRLEEEAEFQKRIDERRSSREKAQSMGATLAELVRQQREAKES